MIQAIRFVRRSWHSAADQELPREPLQKATEGESE
jgi:hypothetical protein